MAPTNSALQLDAHSPFSTQVNFSSQLDSIHLTMNAHELTLGSISGCHKSSFDKCRVPSNRASRIHNPSPSHVNSFYKSGFVQDLRMLGMGCCGCSSGMKRLPVEVTMMSVIPSCIVTKEYFDAFVLRGGEQEVRQGMYFCLLVVLAHDDCLNESNVPLEFCLYR